MANKRIRSLCKQYCHDLNLNLVFSSFKINNLFSVKDPIPVGLRSRVVYKFVCAGCNACYVGETSRHFKTRVREHLTADGNSHILKHLNASIQCKQLANENCFTILDSALTTQLLKIKEALHIQWEQPSLNKQIYHANLTLSF